MAMKKSAPFTLRRSWTPEEPPGLVSLTNTVPASVPSLFQRAWVWVASLASKNTVPFTLVR